jgi:hypothetical protein
MRMIPSFVDAAWPIRRNPCSGVLQAAFCQLDAQFADFSRPLDVNRKQNV